MPVALIIGISGQDGAYLAKLLLEKGYDVVGTSRDHELNPFNNLRRLGLRDRIRMISMAPNDFRSVYKALRESEADEIYNLSGQSSVGLSFEQPMETHESITNSVLNLLECIRLMKLPARFYNAGSSECFGDIDTVATSGTPFRPRSPYGIAKATAHWTVSNYREAYGMAVCSGILFNHESPLRPARFVTRKIVDGAVRIANGSGERLRLGNINISRDWGWAPDYVDAMWRMLQADELRDYLICTGKSHSLQDFLDAVFRELDLDWHDHVDVDASYLRPADINYSCGDPSEAEARLDWRAQTDFRQMIHRLVQAAKTREDAQAS